MNTLSFELLQILLIYKFEKQYKKDKLSPETIKANRERDILPILGGILQDLTRYANNVTHECGELLMKAIHYAQAEWKGLMLYTKDGNYRADNNYAEPIIRGLEAWALDEYPKVLPKSSIGKALNYLITRIKQLTAYTKDGRYMIDNKPIENCVRPLAIGRKNYMFCGNHDAAEEAAIMYTMMGCCKLAGVNFRKWTTHFLSHIHENDNDYSKDLADFLPLRLREKGIL